MVRSCSEHHPAMAQEQEQVHEEVDGTAKADKRDVLDGNDLLWRQIVHVFRRAEPIQVQTHPRE
jgi:hypothetical protein